MEVPVRTARLSEVRRLSPRVLGLTLQAEADFRWSAGQHVRISDPEGVQADAHYSIASAEDAGAPGRLELAVLEESYGYSRQPGAELWIVGPLGQAPYDPLPQTGTLVLIGMGTGVSPLRAVLQAVNRDPSSELTVILIQGARSQSDCIYDAEFRAMSGPSRIYMPVLSREANAPLEGPKRVQDRLADLPVDAYYVLCGSLAMTSDVESRLLARGVASERIVAEGY